MIALSSLCVLGCDEDTSEPTADTGTLPDASGDDGTADGPGEDVAEARLPEGAACTEHIECERGLLCWDTCTEDFGCASLYVPQPGIGCIDDGGFGVRTAAECETDADCADSPYGPSCSMQRSAAPRGGRGRGRGRGSGEARRLDKVGRGEQSRRRFARPRSGADASELQARDPCRWLAATRSTSSRSRTV